MTPEILSASLGAGVGAAFVIGLSFGSGPCNLTCLPYLGPMMLGPAAQQPLYAVLLPFMLGRVLGYMGLGVVAALLGEVVQARLNHPALPLFIAALTGWLALRLFLQSRTVKPLCSATTAPVLPAMTAVSTVADDATKRAGTTRVLIATDAGQSAQVSTKTLLATVTEQPSVPGNRLQLLLLGGTLALNPCLPLIGLLTAAAQSGSPVTGASLALAFGVGAVLVPSLLVRYGVALLGQTIREQMSRWHNGLTRVGAGLLLLVAFSSGWQSWQQLITI